MKQNETQWNKMKYNEHNELSAMKQNEKQRYSEIQWNKRKHNETKWKTMKQWNTMNTMN
jgi:hypothetical protein